MNRDKINSMETWEVGGKGESKKRSGEVKNVVKICEQ